VDRVLVEIRRTHTAIPMIAVSSSCKGDVAEWLEAAGLRRSVWWIVEPFGFENLRALVDTALPA
jgi:hypothetical protein